VTRWVLPTTTVLLAAAVVAATVALLRRSGEAGRGGERAAPAAAPSPPAGGDAPEREGLADAALVRELNETTAVNVLAGLALRQIEVRVQARIDVDHDGRGEAGGFVELSGGVAGRRATPFDPPVLERAYGALDARGELARGGYRYRIFLLGPSGKPVGEGARGFSADEVDADEAERTWWAYAWPEGRGVTGDRTFFVGPSGRVFATDAPHSGPGGGPAADAAPLAAVAAAAGDDRSFPGPDGRTWRLER
jgi:hypothetical protein